jgi:hypothetical protein
MRIADLGLRIFNGRSSVRLRRAWTIRHLLIAGFILGPPLRAQSASPYLPLNHWGSAYLEHWISAGRIADPTPLTRPFRIREVVRALEAMDTTRLGSGERGVVRALLHELARPADGAWWRADADLGLAAATTSLRDPLELGRGVPLRDDTTARGTVHGGLALSLASGPLVLVTHPLFDTRLKYDPDWFGRKDRAIAGRTAESYAAAQWAWGEVFFGRLDRNWGPSVTQGLLLSADPYGLDHLSVSLGPPRVQLQGFVTQLDSRADSTGAIERRYMVQHRLWVHPPGGWTVALWEGLVWAGADRGLEPWYTNLLNLGILEQLNTQTNVNSLLGADVEWRAGGGDGPGPVTVYAQAMLDDIQVDKKTLTDKKPTSWGLTIGAKGGVAGGAAAWTLFYTQVANLTYRNEDNLQVPLYYGLGTGRNFDDYDQATARLSVVAPGGLLLTPEATLLRQGEGDPRLAHPDPAAYATTASLFQGVVQRTLRLALGVNGHAGPFRLEAAGGVHFVSNDGHVTGQRTTRFVGDLQVSWVGGLGGVIGNR